VYLEGFMVCKGSFTKKPPFLEALEKL